MHTIEGARNAGPFRFAVVVSKYHDFVTDRLLSGAVETLTAAGADPAALLVIRVPGAFEIPVAAQHAAEGGQFDAVICLGCLIKGETPHFDFIGRYERLHQDFQTVCDRIGIEGSLPHVNGSRHEHYTEYYDDKSRAFVAERCLRDIERFGYRFGD